MFVQNFDNKKCPCYIYSIRGINIIRGGDTLERVYDTRGRVHGYVDGNTIYDRNDCIAGYTDGCMIYDARRAPMAYVGDRYIYTMDGARVGRYRGYDLYDMSGNHLGYGNSGFGGLLGAALILLLLRRAFRPRFIF